MRALSALMGVRVAVPHHALDCGHAASSAVGTLQVLPGSGRSEMVVGNWYLRHHDLPKARLWLEKSFQAYRGNISTCNLLGTVYFLEGDLKRAEQVLEFGLELRPTDGDIRRLLIEVLAKAERPEATLPHFDHLLRLPQATGADWLRTPTASVARSRKRGVALEASP